MIIAVIDTEATGTEDDARLVEIASVRFDTAGVQCFSKPIFTTLINPGVPIPATASAIHHLTDADVAWVSPFDEVTWAYAAGGADVLAAHNAAFDRRYLPADGRPWICTYRCAVALWPDAPAYGNQVLRYHLGLNPDLAGAGYPHRALYDALVTTEILKRMLLEATPEHLVKITAEPLLLPKVRFGKHEGMRWADVPKDYLDWILRPRPAGKQFDADVLHTAKYWRASV